MKAIDVELYSVASGSAPRQQKRDSLTKLRKVKRELATQSAQAYREAVAAAAPAGLYLLQSHPRRLRYWALVPALEKLALVCVAFFFPATWSSRVAVGTACGIVGAGLVASILLRPLTDGYEWTMDLVSRWDPAPPHTHPLTAP